MCDCVKANNPCCPTCETVVCGALPSANGCTTHSFRPAAPGCSGCGGPVCAVAAPVTCFNGCCGINPLNKHCVGAVNGHSTCAATCTTRNSKGPCYCRSTWGAYPTQPATCGKCICLNGCGPRAAIYPGSTCPNSCNSAFACPDLPWEAARRLFPNINGSWAITLLDWVSHDECGEPVHYTNYTRGQVCRDCCGGGGGCGGQVGAHPGSCGPHGRRPGKDWVKCRKGCGECKHQRGCCKHCDCNFCGDDRCKRFLRIPFCNGQRNGCVKVMALKQATQKHKARCDKLVARVVHGEGNKFKLEFWAPTKFFDSCTRRFSQKRCCPKAKCECDSCEDDDSEDPECDLCKCTVPFIIHCNGFVQWYVGSWSNDAGDSCGRFALAPAPVDQVDTCCKDDCCAWRDCHACACKCYPDSAVAFCDACKCSGCKCSCNQVRLKWSVEGGENSAFNCLIKNILCTLPDPQCLIEPNFPFNAVAESIIHELVDFARDWIECGTITAGNEIIETVADALENFVDRHSEDGVTCRCLSCAKMTTADKDFMKKKIMKLVEEDLINALGSFMDRQSE